MASLFDFFYLTKFSSYFVKTLVQKESVIKYSVSLARQQSFFTYFVISIIFKAGGKLQIFLSSFKNGLITVWRWMLQLLRRKCHHFYRKNTNKSIERHFLNVTLCSLSILKSQMNEMIIHFKSSTLERPFKQWGVGYFFSAQ